MKSKRLCEAEHSALDKISMVPQPILETIVSLLPTDEAVRTSVLSREWRYTWTKIPKLELHLPDVPNGITKEKMDLPRDSFDDILQSLLLHQGQIDEFTLHLSTFRAPRNSVAFDQIIRHLSKNHTIKKFSIAGYYNHVFYKLPISFLSLHHLTDLVLCSVDIDPVHLDSQPILNGFDSLRTLCLQNVGISTETLLHILSHSPSLKSLTLLIGDSHHVDRYCTVIELFNCLSEIEDLTTFGYVFEWLDLEELIPNELPALLHLKYISFKQMCFADGSGLTFLLVLIKCSPKLEKIKLEIELDHACEKFPFEWEEYSDVWLENLEELEIERFGNLEPEMKFVKFILSRSPNLKKVSIISTVDRYQESVLLKTLSQAQRSSPHQIQQQEHMTEMGTTPLCKAEQQSSLGIISTLPEIILETILCFLPTKEAARTSILSKEWRYKWTTIPILDFYQSDVSITEENQVEGKQTDRACKPFYDLLQILKLHRGTISELTLEIDLHYDSFGLDQIMLYLSKSHVLKKLTLNGWNDRYWDNLPISIFSLHHLTDLNLSYFEIDYQSTFNGFGSLRSLSLHCIGISFESLVHLLSNCASLESLTLWIVLDSLSEELPTLQFHLKYICFEDMYFVDDQGLAFLLVLIRCSPNLEKIKINIELDWLHNEEYSLVWEDYSDVWLEHLNELEIEYFENLESEMEFVKFILAKSPKLKKVSIMSTINRNQESEMLKTLSQAPRSSQVLIIMYRHSGDICFKEL